MVGERLSAGTMGQLQADDPGLAEANKGAANYRVMENRSLVGQVLFDWLDTVFK